jgi:hypothetical protein
MGRKLFGNIGGAQKSVTGLKQAFKSVKSAVSDVGDAIKSGLNEPLGKTEDQLKSVYDLQSDITKQVQLQATQAKAVDGYFTDIGKSLGYYGSISTEINQIQQELSNTLKESLDTSTGLLDTAKSYEAIEQAIAESEKFRKMGLDDIADALLNEVASAKAYVDAEQETINLLGERDRILETINEKAGGFIDSIENGIKGIPVVGDLLASTMDFEGLKENFNTNIKESFTSGFMDVMNSGGTAMEAMSAGLTGAIGPAASFGATLWAALLPILPIVLAIVGAMMMLKSALAVDEEVTKFGRELGLAKDEAHGLNNEIKEAVQADISINAEEARAVVGDLANEFGSMNHLNAEMIKDTAKLTKFMGMSGEEAAGFAKMAAASGQSVREVQGEVAEVVDGFNKATGQSISLSKVMQGVAKVSRSVRIEFAGGVKELALTVAKAEALGTSVDTLASSTKGMLDIQTSLGKQYEAQALTGRQLNLDAIRQAELMGDKGKAIELLTKDIGKQSDIILSKGYGAQIQREALAEAYGMEVDELMKIAEQQRLIEKAGGDLNKLTIAQLEANTRLTDEEKERLIKQKEALSTQEALNGFTTGVGEIWDRIMSKAITPLLASFNEILQDTETMSIIMGVIEAVFSVLTLSVQYFMIAWKIIFSRVKAVVGAFQGLWDIVSGIFLLFTDWDAGVEKIKEGFLGLGQALWDWFVEPFVIVGRYIADIIDTVLGWFGITTDLGGLIDEYLTFDKLMEGINWVIDNFDSLWEGFKSIGQAILDFMMAPIDSIKAAWDYFFGDDEEVNVNVNGNVDQVEAVDDLIVTPEGKTFKTAPDDFIIATKATPTAVSSAGGDGGGDSSELITLLKQLITASDQPIMLKLDDGTVQKIGRRQSFLGKRSAGLGLG